MSDELADRVAKLEADLAEAKKALEAVKPKEPFRPRMTMPKIDYTEGMSASGPALKPMVDLVNPQGLKYDPGAWRRNSPSEPGGFGPAGQWPKPKPTKNVVVKDDPYVSVRDGLWSKPK